MLVITISIRFCSILFL